MARKKTKKFDQAKGVRRLARERVGQVAPVRILEEKDRKNPKHKKPPDIEADNSG
jgi:hypothetical protein